MSANEERKLDIFQLLNGLSKGDVSVYHSLSDQEKKEVLPLIVMRWMSGTIDERQIVFLNELVNPFVFPFYKHKDLLVDLLAVCGPGTSRRYTWNKALSKKKSAHPKAVEVIKQYFHYNTVGANEALGILSADDIVDYAQQLGWQPDDISKLKKELKDR